MEVERRCELRPRYGLTFALILFLLPSCLLSCLPSFLPAFKGDRLVSHGGALEGQSAIDSAGSMWTVFFQLNGSVQLGSLKRGQKADEEQSLPVEKI